MPRIRKNKESLKGKKIMSSDDEDSGLPHTSPFEAIRAEAEDGSEYWSARDLSKILGYTEWRNFTTAIEKAKEACENSGQAVSDHFVEANKLIETAKGARRKIEDYQQILDYMGSDELAANIFRSSQTKQMLEREQ